MTPGHYADESCQLALYELADLLASSPPPYPVDHPHLSREELRERGWTTGMIVRLLGREDRRDAVNHWANYSGKCMYAVDRVERIESLPRFQTAFENSLKRRNLDAALVSGVRRRIGKFQRAERWNDPFPSLDDRDRLCVKLSGILQQARSRGYRTPHKG